MEKLVDITWSSTKRLMNVCKKYGSDDSVKEMLIKSMNKLMDNGHVVLFNDLQEDLRKQILNASPSYTIPADVVFKERSVSTPARWVFDAGSKTAGGYSLNDLLT